MPLELLIEEVAHAAQVPRPLFTHIGHEDHAAGGVHMVLLIGASDREHHGEAAAVVADAGGVQSRAVLFDMDVGALGEDRIEVTGDDDGGLGARACALGDDIPHGINARGETQRLKAAFHLGATHGLLEGRGGDLADGTLLAHRSRRCRS